MTASSDGSEATTAAESVPRFHSPSNESQEDEQSSINKYMTGLKAKHPINSFMLSPFFYPLSVCVREFLVLPFSSESPADSVCSHCWFGCGSEFETSSHREGRAGAARQSGR